MMKDPLTRSSFRSLRKDQDMPKADVAWPEDDDRRIAPTQRLSEVRWKSGFSGENMLIGL